MIRRLFSPLASLLLLGAAISGAAPDAARAQAAEALRVPLTIQSGKKILRYTVELAVTPEDQARGLMYRTSLPRDGGMIFPFAPPREATFWMKNTFIPLDLIFIRANGSIARIAANAAPRSLEIIASGEPVAAVLEIRGGGAAEDGIRPGDRVRWGRTADASR